MLADKMMMMERMESEDNEIAYEGKGGGRGYDARKKEKYAAPMSPGMSAAPMMKQPMAQMLQNSITSTCQWNSGGRIICL